MQSIRVDRSVRAVSSLTTRPPLTHFLSLPIGHHPELCEAWTRVSTAFLESSPPIPGLHESVMIKPGGLHLTLGVLSLASSKPSRSEGKIVAKGGTSQGGSGSARTAESSSIPRRHAVDEALELLRTLEQPIKNLLNGNGGLMVPLERMGVMRSRPNQSLDQSHVMWAGPDLNSQSGKLLSSVCDLVHSTFKNSGMLQDDRPLKLHCTLINTVYRKETSTSRGTDRRFKNRKRIPFSFTALLSSSAYEQIAVPMSVGFDMSNDPDAGQRINLGAWAAEEVQLCEMGSKDADGVYQSVGSISIRP